jgi:hypothetical protein
MYTASTHIDEQMLLYDDDELLEQSVERRGLS